MLKKIDHIGIAVSSLSESVPVFQKMGLSYLGEEEVAEQKVKVAFFDIGGVHIELLEPTAPDSPIAIFLEKKGQGIHHLALESDGLEQEINQLISDGISMIDMKPRTGAHNSKIAFIHPKSSAKVLTELCEHCSEGH